MLTFYYSFKPGHTRILHSILNLYLYKWKVQNIKNMKELEGKVRQTNQEHVQTLGNRQVLRQGTDTTKIHAHR